MLYVNKKSEKSCSMMVTDLRVVFTTTLFTAVGGLETLF